MIRLIAAVLIPFMLIFSAGCDFGSSPSKKTLVVYSEVEPELTEALLATYNEQFKTMKDFQEVSAVYELNDKEKPDLVLAGSRTLTGLKADKRLQQSSFKPAETLPLDFKDVDGYWTGVFYDPVVFVINQSFARRVGQSNLRGWNDLENLKNVRYVVENLNNSQGTMNLLAAMASHMGEESAISYLWNLSRNITAYGKFPFSTIRMVATGEADMTVTVQSVVCKYLENEFPAYCLMPKEGTPANLYGIAVFKDSKKTARNEHFMTWLLTDDNAKMVVQKQDAGYMFLLKDKGKKLAVEPQKIWLNRDYLTLPKLEALTNQWVEKVRFNR